MQRGSGQKGARHTAGEMPLNYTSMKLLTFPSRRQHSQRPASKLATTTACNRIRLLISYTAIKHYFTVRHWMVLKRQNAPSYAVTNRNHVPVYDYRPGQVLSPGAFDLSSAFPGVHETFQTQAFSRIERGHQQTDAICQILLRLGKTNLRRCRHNRTQ